MEKNAALVLYLEAAKDLKKSFIKKRVKREVVKMHKRRHHKQYRKHSMSKENTQCRRTEMYVDFGELNWKDWILAPGNFFLS